MNLIDAIRHTLLEHQEEEPYQLGAWENFERHRRRKQRRRMAVRLSSAAAVLAVVVLPFALLTTSEETGTNLIGMVPFVGQEKGRLHEPGAADLQTEGVDGVTDSENVPGNWQDGSGSEPQESVDEAHDTVKLAGAGRSEGEGGSEETTEMSTLAANDEPDATPAEDRRGSEMKAGESMDGSIASVDSGSSSVPGTTDEPVAAEQLNAVSADDPEESVAAASSVDQGESDAADEPGGGAGPGDLAAIEITESLADPTPFIAGYGSSSVDFPAALHDSREGDTGGSAVISQRSGLDDSQPVVRDLSGSRQGEVTFGVAYAPLLNFSGSSADWNIGGGLSVAWQFHDKLALTSGLYLAQNQLEFSNGRGGFATMAEFTGGRAEEMNMRVDLINLEIPVQLQVSLSDRFFVSAGVASGTFLRESYSYDFSYRREFMQVFMENGETRTMHREVTVSETAQHTEASMKRFNPLSSWNLSMGYQMTINENRRISLEPFVKLPAGSVSSENISYTTAGLQFRLTL